MLCRVLDVARSGFYAWGRRPLGIRARQNQGLVMQIRTRYQAARGRYGSPRIHQDLRAQGVRVRSIRRRRAWRAPGMSAPGVVAKNILRREFAATQANEKWAGDITYVPTREGWLYLSVLMDLYSRRIVGWAMDDQGATSLTLSALEMALRHRAVRVDLLHHSDRGSQYGALAYQQRLAIRGIRCSMSRPGNCWDNAVVESFFASLKTELLTKGHPFSSRQEARTAIFEYVEGFYNRARRHSTLGYLSPVEFEQRAAYSTTGVH